MRCIKCGGNTRVTNIRNNLDNKPRRRRECLKCKSRFTTYEVIVEEKVLKDETPKENTPIRPTKPIEIKKDFKKTKLKIKEIPKIKRPLSENIKDIEFDDLDDAEIDYEGIVK